MKEIRLLKASEIECRVGRCGKSGMGWCSILLYKDARCDQRILDEVFGPFGWQRRHEAVNGQVCCIVKVKDHDTNEWIEKEDVGTESNTEAVKGQFSDSFKRACFNLGIGRELYTAPKIFITLGENEMDQKNGRWTVSPKVVFTVAEIGYDENRNINALTIVDNSGVVRYKLGQVVQQQAQQVQKQQAQQTQEGEELTTDDIFNGFAVPAIEQAQSQTELTRIWNDFPKLQGETRFSDALNARLNEIKQAA